MCVLSIFLSTIFAWTPALSAPTADEYVKQADEIRNPSQSYQMSLKVQTAEKTTEFEVYLKGTTETLIVTKAPAADRGRNMLMLDRDFYSYVPNLKRSVRLSLAQKLGGQVANGDIARTRWYGDYSAKIEKEEGKEVQLLLEARKENLTYNKIRLWVDKASKRPLRTEYLSLDGKRILKKAFFEDFKTLAGAPRPGMLRIVDTNGEASTIQILQMKTTDFDQAFFSRANMEKMK